MKLYFKKFLNIIYTAWNTKNKYRRGTMSICWNFPSNNNGKISGISEAGIETLQIILRLQEPY